jgi:hypothetical protein
MSSREGYGRADIDTGFFHDPKLRALARRLQDPQKTMAAAGLYLATVLASWHEDRRLTIDEAAPGWWLDEPREYLEDLIAVGLLDEEARVPLHAYEAWTARPRRAQEAGRKAATQRWKQGGIPMLPQHERVPPKGDRIRPHGDGMASQYPESRPAGRPGGRPDSTREITRAAETAGAGDRAQPVETRQPPPALGDFKAQVARHGYDPDGFASMAATKLNGMSGGGHDA